MRVCQCYIGDSVVRSNASPAEMKNVSATRWLGRNSAATGQTQCPVYWETNSGAIRKVDPDSKKINFITIIFVYSRKIELTGEYKYL